MSEGLRIDGQPVTPGTRLDRYEVVGPLGSGGMADVFQVRHVELGTLHALKLLRVQMPGLQDRLVVEGRVQASLKHENVVAVTDIIRVGGIPGLVMELIQGPSLDRLLAAYQPSDAQVDAIARGMLRGVAAAHARGTVHRDLKPANVMIANEPRATGDRRIVPKVTDFGLAKALADQPQPSLRTRSGATLGTPTFMAPEQFRSAKNADHRADIFSLGAILYELISGAPAFMGEDLIEIYDQTSTAGYRPLREVAPHVPQRMADAVDAALKPDPDDRPQTVEDLLAMWSDGTPEPVAAWEDTHIELVASLTSEVDPNQIHDVTMAAGIERRSSPFVPNSAPRMPLREGRPKRDTPTDRGTREGGGREPAGGNGVDRTEASGPAVPATQDPAAFQSVDRPVSGGPSARSVPLEPIQDAMSEPRPVRHPRRALALVALIVVGMFVFGGMTGLGVLGATLFTAGDPVFVPEAEPELQPDPMPQPPTPAPEPDPAPVPDPTPEPDPAPVPDPTPEPDPAPVPDPTPQPEGPVGAEDAVVTLTGADRGFLVDIDTGARYAIGTVPAGTYHLYVYVDDREPVRVLKLGLTPGQQRTLTCKGDICR